MISEAQISKFIAKLILSTKDNSVKWTTPLFKIIDSLESEEVLIGRVFISEFMDKKIRLYKYSKPIQVDEFEYLNKTFLRLEFIDDKYRNLWSFPDYTREIYDLYETVQIKFSNIDDFFDDNFPNNVVF